ncbi:FAD-dependent monooxygenase [Halocatena marina]|uniref:FAD-dependent monooxygenase n=1 Tax=Halocatena marina TaxID=2934937 RepID=UPI0034A30817
MQQTVIIRRNHIQDSIESETDVLIVGAGSIDLTIAIELQRRGIDCRIVEKDASSMEYRGLRCPRSTRNHR